jgi:hypothetical protein
MLAEGGRVVAADVSAAGLADTVAKAGDAADRLTAIEVNIGDEASVTAASPRRSRFSAAWTCW